MLPSPGQVIEAPSLAARAEGKVAELRNGYYLLEVVLDDGHSTCRRMPVTPGQLDPIRMLSATALAPTADAEDPYLYLKGSRLQLPYQLDPLISQIAWDYPYVPPCSHARFLIVAPSHLKYQWQCKMKLGLSFVIVDRGVMSAAGAECDEEIEAVGMAEGMVFGRAQGQLPEDMAARTWVSTSAPSAAATMARSPRRAPSRSRRGRVRIPEWHRPQIPVSRFVMG